MWNLKTKTNEPTKQSHRYREQTGVGQGRVLLKEKKRKLEELAKKKMNEQKLTNENQTTNHQQTKTTQQIKSKSTIKTGTAQIKKMGQRP